jgi:hypothetical protein
MGILSEKECLVSKYLVMKNPHSNLFLSLIGALMLFGCTEDPEILPRLSTVIAVDTDITATTATLKGEITVLGNVKIEQYGIEISKSMIFTPSQTKGFTTAATQGIYQVSFTGLDPATLYYFRAYAVVNTARVNSVNYFQFTTKN